MIAPNVWVLILYAKKLYNMMQHVRCKLDVVMYTSLHKAYFTSKIPFNVQKILLNTQKVEFVGITFSSFQP